MANWLNAWKHRLVEHEFVFAAAAFALATGLAGSAIHESILALALEPQVTVSWIRVFELTAFIFCSIWLYRSGRKVFRPRTRHLRTETPEKRENLILFLSNLKMRSGIFSDDGRPNWVTLNYSDLEADLDTLLSAQGPNWQWEMPLRGICHHLGKLNRIILICSPESICQVHWFRSVIAKYSVLADLPVLLFVKNQQAPPALIECPKDEARTQGGWEFEQFDDLSEAVLQLLSILTRLSVPETEIMIDFTGGQKVTSVVAASVTFNRPIKVQYVQTNHPKNVVGYDLVLSATEQS